MHPNVLNFMTRRSLPLFLIFPLFLVFVTPSKAQRWKRYRHEVSFNFGAANYLGDLGGATTGEGTRFGDFQFVITRPAFGASYRYRLTERFAVKGNLLYGRVYGDDAEAGNPGRQARNLNFRSNVVEFSVQGELYFLKESSVTAYRMPGMQGGGSSPISGYLFGGIGLFYFDPQGEDANGDWVKLADLNTEGQGLPGGPSDYSRIAITAPIGFGFKYTINRQWNVGIEYGVRMTTTDYLDDVSTDYYDPTALAAAYGDKAVEMADKRINLDDGADLSPAQAGGQRGGEALDSYMFGFVTIGYKFKTGKRGRTRF